MLRWNIAPLVVAGLGFAWGCGGDTVAEAVGGHTGACVTEPCDGAANPASPPLDQGAGGSESREREEPVPLCSNTCSFARDGSCDDGGPKATGWTSCRFGTDCADCGVRSSADAPEAKNNGESSIGEPSSIPGTGGAGSGSDGGAPQDPGVPAGSGGGAVTPPAPPTPPTPPAPPPRCSLIFSGGSGGDPDGRIPVCCNATEQENAANNEVFRLLNQHRQNNGRAPVARDPLLESAAMGHCLHMATHGFFDHQAPEPAVVTPWARAERCGTTAGGENIAMGQRSPMEVVVGWINSPGHNANMLNGSFKRVGMGHCGTHWVQLFGY